MTGTHRSRLLFELHRAAVVGAFATGVVVTLYVPPTFLEWLLSGHFNSQAVCAGMGDSASYLALFWLGFKRQAAAVYVFAKLFEVTLLKGHVIALADLFWLTDAIPTAYCAILLCKIVYFSDQDPQDRFSVKTR
jgi:hypothetical protein